MTLVPETKKLFSLFGNIWKLTVFAIWKHSEAFGSWLFSLFGSIRKYEYEYLEADCFRYLETFGSIWKLTVFAIWKHSEAFGSWLFSLFGSIRKHLEADCFHYFGLFWYWKNKSAETVKLPNASSASHWYLTQQTLNHQLNIFQLLARSFIPQILNPETYILDPRLEVVNLTPKILNPKPYTLNPSP
jgi:hypothetical protein